jgi:hypothetical protein
MEIHRAFSEKFPEPNSDIVSNLERDPQFNCEGQFVILNLGTI